MNEPVKVSTVNRAKFIRAMPAGREMNVRTTGKRREKKAVSTLKRRFESPEFTPGQPLSEMRCLMEQGYMCLGPATRSGCGGTDGIPRCIRAYMPCEGCFGPLSEKANPMVDMMGALASIGLDPKTIPDRAATFNRFSGAGRLRPLPKR